MADRASRVAALSPEKRALLARRVAALRATPAGPVALSRRPGVNVFRTSFAQERLWVLEQLAPGSAAYNVSGVYRATGRLDREALTRSVEALVARHESFRTTFVAVDGLPRQIVSPAGVASVSFQDLRSRGAGAAADAAAMGETRRPFDVARGPLLRVAIFVVGEDQHVVAVTMHHLVADAWSIDVFVRELAIAYRASVSGRPPAWSPPHLHYADHAEWQRADLERPARRGPLLAYWRARLRDLVYPDVPEGDRLAFRGAAVTRELPAALAESVRAFARQEGVTLFVVLLTAWVAALARRVGRTDVTVIAPVANRDRPEVAETIGFFVNLVALRATWPGDASFRALVQRVKEVVRGALVHQDLPFELLLDELNIPRSLARPPLSPYAFALERSIARTIALPDVAIAAVESDDATSRTDLALIVREDGRAIAVRLERDRDLYEASVAERLLSDVVTGLERGLTAPDRPLSDARLRGADVTAAVPVETACATVWHRFARRAAATPTAHAVGAGGRAVTYAELEARAHAAAARLAAAGVGPGSIVGVSGERGIGWLATLLGLWRLGAVYLPLDPRWPPARIADVVERSGARVLATGRETPAPLRTAARGAAWSLVPIDDASPGSDPVRGDDRAVAVGGGDLAYVLYTSGSTGAPKGALIEHGGLLNHLAAKCALLELGPEDRVAQTAAVSFDISLWQALAVLLVGGAVEVLPDDVGRDPTALARAVAAGVTVLQVVPGMLRALVDAEGEGAPDGPWRALDRLRWLVVTGEALAPALCRAWLARHPTVPLVNAYGPTECADDVAHHVIRSAPAPDAVRVPIGRPIAGVTLRVLDAALRPVAAGAEGELCVSGIAVGRGYLDDPERTAAAFIAPDPFDGRPGSRLYRTGDRGRERTDGLFEYLGRGDAQVKIRGQRVEPGEVEAVLCAHPAVREAAVVADAVAGAGPRLVAYVVAAAPGAVSMEELRRYVAGRLPDAMVPATIEALPTMPRDANGKLDRRGLPAATAAPEDAAAYPTAIAGDVARRLAEIWRTVLGVEVRSLGDDFFALGGDSLTSLRVVALARRAGVLVTPQQIFEQRTLGRLAGVAGVASPGDAEQGLVTGDVRLTPVQRMFFEAGLPAPHHYNLSVMLEVPDPPAPPLLALAVEHLLRHHDVLRLRFRSDGRDWCQTIDDVGGEIPFSRLDLAAVGDDELATSLAAEGSALQASLDLAAGPLVRVALFDLGPRRSSRLLLVVHHLACDVVSLPLLLEDLATVYDQLRRGEPVALPAKTVSFQAWARALADYGRAPARLDDLAWWQRECAEPGARLARGDGNRAAAIADIEHLGVTLEEPETRELMRYAAGREASMEAALATALVLAVTDVVGGEAVLVYLERHGRGLQGHFDVSRTVGWFTAVFPVRLVVAAGRRPAATLARIAAHLHAVPDGGLGFGAVWCRGDAAASALRALPRPEISLNYLGRCDPPANVPWRLAPESPGREHGRGGRRPTLLDLTARVERGRLRLDWAYDAVELRRSRIAAVAARALAVLRELATEVPDA